MDPNQAIRSALTRVKQTTTPRGRQAAGCFSLEGTRALERALRADAAIAQVWFGETAANAPDEREQALLQVITDRTIPLTLLPDAVMHDLTDGRKFGACVALAALPDEQPPIPASGVYVVAVDIVDPGNVGGMIRTALAAGADGLITTGTTDPWHPKAVRTSMGSVFKLPIYPLTGEDLREQMRDPDTQVIGLTPEPGALPLQKVRRKGTRTFLCMGSEAYGLPAQLLAEMNTRVKIPMVDVVDSYSVNVATGIALYQLMHGDGTP